MGRSSSGFLMFRANTSFRGVDLSTAKELATIQHSGKTIIDRETIIKSAGKMPESFLIGCQVPQEILDLARTVRTL